MHRFLILLLTCMSIALAFDSLAARPKRNAQSVKKERRLAAGELERTRKQINQNTAETKRQLNRLASLTADAERSNRLIDGLRREISDIDSRINALDDTIALMDKNLAALRESYAENLRSTRSRRQQMSTLAMIFSSSSFTEAYRRYRYLQQLELWQKDKTRQLRTLAADVAERRDKVKKVRETRAQKLADLTEENNRLIATRSETETLVSDLRRQGSSLKKALDEKQKQLKDLDAELDRIIAEEARRAEEARKAEEARLAAEAKKKAEEARKAAEAEKKAKNSDKKGQASSPGNTPSQKDTAKPAAPGNAKTPTQFEREASERVALTGSFESNKGRMPFPVAGLYSIVSHFGLNSHPDVTTVKVNNSGIDIETPPGASARAVFDGEVSSVFRVSGYQNVVMLRHGNYLTVYAGIDNLSVKKGDKVKAGQTLGSIYSDPDDSNRTVLHFEVRRERAKLNPEDWVK